MDWNKGVKQVILGSFLVNRVDIGNIYYIEKEKEWEISSPNLDIF